MSRNESAAAKTERKTACAYCGSKSPCLPTCERVALWGAKP